MERPRRPESEARERWQKNFKETKKLFELELKRIDHNYGGSVIPPGRDEWLNTTMPRLIKKIEHLRGELKDAVGPSWHVGEDYNEPRGGRD